MLNTAKCPLASKGFPNWLPVPVQNYLWHTEHGFPIRELARRTGCHASTILRQIRKTEARRDDPLVDTALIWLGQDHSVPARPTHSNEKDFNTMNMQTNTQSPIADPDHIARESKRILRRLCEPAACLAVASEMEKAVVVRETTDGRTIRTAITDRPVVHAMALNDWIASAAGGRISRYQITPAGRGALKRMLDEDQSNATGFAEARATFDGSWADPQMAFDDPSTSRSARYSLAESPVSAIARRKDKAGNPFLSADLVAVAERVREDFELARMGQPAVQNWEPFLNGGGQASPQTPDPRDGAAAARARVGNALRDLGPGLGDVVLRVCCYMDGVETAEKRMGWSARSGKIVLRIALQRLKRHYEQLGNSALIG
ncbi:MAG: DUF6456 domain-containing protein [Marinosulfonomonas sp.]